MSKTFGLVMEPLDVLFFRDGRPFGASEHGHSMLPTPQVLAGAVRTAVIEQLAENPTTAFENLKGGFARDRLPANLTWLADVHFRGPWLARLNDKEGPEVFLPIPAVLHQLKGPAKGESARSNNGLFRLGPLRQDLPGWQPPEEGMRPLWLKSRETTEAVDGFLALEALKPFLAGALPSSSELLKTEKLYGYDSRTGIGINADRLSAEESQIYGINFLALRSAYVADRKEGEKGLGPVGLYAEIVTPKEAPADPFAGIQTLRLGGEGKRVRLVVQDPVQMPSPGRGGKELLVLTTPGLFRAGWRPESLKGKVLAAAVPSPVAVSGWDLAKGGPKPTRFAAPAGSVYFFDGPAPEFPNGSMCDDPQDAQLGYGCYLRGVWNDE